MVKQKKTLRIKLAPKRAMRAPKQQSASQQETTAVGKALRALGSAGGAALGGYFGIPPSVAGVAGNTIAGAISRWLGQGDYTVGTNSVVASSLKAASSIPSMHKDGQSIIVQHKEYLGEVRGSTTFQVLQSYVLNPGNPITFPWLSDIAAKFQEYRIRGAVFHYVPSSGAVASGTNPGLGTVMLQTTYRSTDSAPANKVEMLNEYCSNEVVPSEAMAHPIECDPKENPFNVQYVRSGAVPVGDTQLMYDLGVTHLAVSGQQASGNVIGDLWITYDVELKKPIVTSNSSFTSKYFQSGSPSASLSSLFTGAVTAGNWPCTVATNTLTFPRGSVGTWVVGLQIAPSSSFTQWSTNAGVTLANCSFSSITPANWGSFSPGGSTETTGVYKIVSITISDPAVSATVTYPTFSITGTVIGNSLFVCQISD